MKKHLTPAKILVALLIAMLPLMSACAVDTHPVNATVYGSGSDNISEAAKAADQAMAEITWAPDIIAPETIEAGTLKVASDSSYPPLEYLAKLHTVVDGEQTESKEVVGFEIDLCRAIAKKLGLEATFVTTSLSEVSSVLAGGEVDMAASALITSPGLLTQFSASDTYLAADLVICTVKGGEPLDETALQGQIVGTQTGSTAEPAVAGMQGIAEIRLYSHVLDAFADLEERKIDAVVVEELAAEWILANDPSYATALEIDSVIETGEGYAFWCTKESQDLVDAINAALAELKQPPVSQLETTTTADAASDAQAGAEDTAGATTTTGSQEPAKSVYQLLLEKWGLTVD